tara:strand:- start:1364 stop:1888 length:525 start_codon:yes stop_codon:yes gene_type:complete
MMNDILLKRIIGILFLFTLVIIFIPILFNANGVNELNEISLKKPKEVKFQYIEEINSLKKDASKDIESINYISSEETVEIKDIDSNDSGKNTAWVIRVGTFKNNKNAINVLDKLKLQGYRGNIIKFKNKDKVELYKVNIGPFFSTKKLKEKYKEILSNKNIIKPFIVKYTLRTK